MFLSFLSFKKNFSPREEGEGRSEAQGGELGKKGASFKFLNNYFKISASLGKNYNT